MGRCQRVQVPVGKAALMAHACLPAGLPPSLLSFIQQLSGKWALLDFGSLGSAADVKGINVVCR